MSTTGYLARLGLDAALPPTLASLTAIHRAHLTQVPYENLGIMLGRPPSVSPTESLARIAGVGRAGYCFHHNGALEVALRELGFDVERRFGHVWTRPEDRGGPQLNHLVLVVTGLPTAANPGGRWWPDVGLGEGFLEPLPLVAGTVSDGLLTFAIAGALDAVTNDGWDFVNDRTGTFAGMRARDRPVDDDVVAAAHRVLSTPPDGAFTRLLVVQRRRPEAMETVRGCTAVRVDAAGRHERDVTSWADWRAALDDVGLPLGDVEVDELRGLFDRMLVAHRTWDEKGRP